MKKKTAFNIGALTASNLTVRVLGMFYKMWLAQSLSPVALGLMQLALSVCAFFMTPVASGLPNAVSRLAARYAGEEKRVLTSALRIALPLVLFLCLLLLFGKNLLASLFLHDAGAGNVLLCLIPAVALGSLAALPAGYLHARGKSARVAGSEVIEQLSKIGFAFLLIRLFGAGSENVQASLPLLALSFSGVVSFILLFGAVGRADWRKHGFEKELLQNALPLTGSRMTTGLIHLGTTAVLPIRLMAYGLSRETALAQYGLLTSLAYPVVYLPMTVIGALCVVFLPAVARSLQNPDRLRRTFCKAFGSSLLLSLLFVLLLLLFGPWAARTVLARPEIGRSLILLTPSVLFLGLRQICATALNGLGKQGLLFWVNLADSLLGFLLTFFLTGLWGMDGFLIGNGVQDFCAFAALFVLCLRFLPKKD